LLGSNRNENFLGGRGDDLIDGRNGFDRAVYSTSTDDAVTSAITVNLAAGTVQGDASVGTATLRSIEAVQGSDFADSYDATGYGAAGAANVGNNGTFNEFEGGGGNDTIIGNGSTRIAFYNAAAGVTVNLTTNSSQGTAGGDVAFVGTDTFSGISAVAGSAFADSITGSDNAANTTEEFAGRRNDVIDGKNGFDRAYYNDDPTGAGIQVNMASGAVTGDAAIGTDTLRSIESIRGTNFADTYVATNFGAAGFLDPSVNNVGNNGTFNEIEGLGGNDTITGNGNTRIAFYNASAGVTVDLAAGTSFSTASGDAANVGTDTFTLVNAVRGSNFADTILGDANGNTLDGRAGDDRIDGRGGNDTLFGGTGADTFVYADGGGADTIMDFNRAEGDKIDLTGVSSILTFADIQFNSSVGNTVITFSAGNTLTLNGVTSLQQSDFILPGIINGTPNADVLTGTSQVDAIFGLDGNDRLQGLAGNDRLDGGNGFDRAIYTDATGPVTVNLAVGTAGGAGVGTDTLVNIKGAVGSDFADTFNAAGFTGSTGQPGLATGQNSFEGRGATISSLGISIRWVRR
jgi:Ca2+-binding RTX toxin-like protein